MYALGLLIARPKGYVRPFFINTVLRSTPEVQWCWLRMRQKDLMK
jgi:hypothetical protein